MQLKQITPRNNISKQPLTFKRRQAIYFFFDLTFIWMLQIDFSIFQVQCKKQPVTGFLYWLFIEYI